MSWEQKTQRLGRKEGHFQSNHTQVMWLPGCYCWCFRNPKANHLTCMKTLKIMGINYQPQLVQDFFHQQYYYFISFSIGKSWSLNRSSVVFTVTMTKTLCIAPWQMYGKPIAKWKFQPGHKILYLHKLRRLVNNYSCWSHWHDIRRNMHISADSLRD